MALWLGIVQQQSHAWMSQCIFPYYFFSCGNFRRRAEQLVMFASVSLLVWRPLPSGLEPGRPRSLLPTGRHSSSSHMSQPLLPYMVMVTDCLFVLFFAIFLERLVGFVSGSSLLFRTARGKGAVRELDWRKVPHPSASTTAAPAWQRSTLLLITIRRWEEGTAAFLSSTKTWSSWTRHCAPTPRRQSHTDQLHSGRDPLLF